MFLLILKAGHNGKITDDFIDAIEAALRMAGDQVSLLNANVLHFFLFFNLHICLFFFPCIHELISSLTSIKICIFVFLILRITLADFLFPTDFFYYKVWLK